ncbi:MAG: OmcA/MtrC family decaheme c-type cytochrome [Acidobacteriota bacterium]|nr:OmcA/MtrC family decaheme c-type cytochrome [Blastocatellia bacterium]MDW8238612.1 OmcA/MtrC family decaheme c-type cytochrome [Acidobacteriota bacterium]
MIRSTTMRTRIKLAFLIAGFIALVAGFDPGGLIAQQQVLPRPGLKLEILGVTIPESRKPEVTFKITDERGMPLDKDGVTTEGVVTLRFLIARIRRGERQYTSYIVRQQTGAALGTVDQAAADSGGTYAQVGPGTYTYTFGTTLPANYDRTVTHTVGVYANRDMTHVDGNDYVAAATFDFVPNGTPVTVKRDVVNDAACNKCHDQLTAHGVRRSVALCVLCHTPQTPDPDTGNTTDFNVMIHKIHRGADLPSVRAGRPYQLIGNRGVVHDYSKVRFPQDIRNCDSCHTGSQGMNALTRPSRIACGSCHDNVNFATGQGHGPGIPQTNDLACGFCHQPTSTTEFDLSVAGAHVIPNQSRQLPGIKYTIVRVENTAAGQRPRVIFNITDNAGRPIQPSQMSRLALVLGGPTSDYSRWWTEDARMATPTGDGNYAYTFNTAIPADATGTYTVTLEGRRNVQIIGPNFQPTTIQDTGPNVTKSFAVTGPLVERRVVVDLAKCNACHDMLRVHGDNRFNNVQYCAVCHNPNQTDVARRPQAELPAESVDFKYMIHRIHAGKELSSDFTVYGFGGTAYNYNNVGFPGRLTNCTMCHVAGTHLIGSTAGRLPTVTPRSLINPTPPISAACVGCHDSQATLAHVSLNTSLFGESCAVCHGEGREFAVSKSHFRRPDAR